MKKTIESKVMGIFSYNENNKVYELRQDKLHWTITLHSGLLNSDKMIEKAEKIFSCLEEFDQKLRLSIAEKLVDFKNDFWPEYDENDKDLDWDAVDAGAYDISTEHFANTITLYDIKISVNKIYCEFDDGDLFGGHRIHAYIDEDFNLISVDV